ncbi:hypothetical protein [Streptomyces fructofermentans]|uniref:hypothetical protein n=1 Tax=Streptomyces fructofermentans TaxID=152141 RepID=UPI0033DBF003
MDDKDKMALAAAVMGGYVVGRTKKGRLALSVATYLAGRRFGLEPRQLAAEGVRRLAELPQVAQLQEQLRGEVLEAARKAVTATADRGMSSLAGALSDRTAKLGKKEDEEEPEEEEPEEEEPEARPRQRRSRKAPALAGEEAAPARGAKRAAKKTAPAKKSAAKKTASSKPAASKRAGRRTRRRETCIRAMRGNASNVVSGCPMRTVLRSAALGAVALGADGIRSVPFQWPFLV